MNDKDQVVELLARIEENQRKALDVQQRHLEIAQAQHDRANQSIQESIALQRAAVSRAAQITKVVLPLIAVLLALLGYVLIKWRVL